ncbi:MAG TPA: RluA family pseudouridine synthase [Casimicrobiaceae bacterium]
MNELRKDAVNHVTIGEEAAGQRVDNYLARCLKGVPKSHIYRILRSGEVRINGGRAGPDAKLASGDRIRIPPIRVAEPSARTPARPLSGAPVLFEDEAILALDKPAGLAVHGGSGVAHGLIEQLRAARPQARFLELVHRLDRETSGVLLVAKKRAALVALHAAWRGGDVDKRYYVLVRGRWRDAMRRVSLGVHKFVSHEGERRVRIDDDGQSALTIFRSLDVWAKHVPPLALLEAELRTGRTHQIRVHLTHLGFPLAGDDKYGDFAWNRELAKAGLKRMFLHAARLSLAHPLTGEPLAIHSPLPDDLARYLATISARSSDA